MDAFIYRPGPPLCEFIDWFWFWDGRPLPAPKERVLPSGAFDLVINLGDERFRFYDPIALTPLEPLAGPIVSGAHASHFVIGSTTGTALMGVHFKPGGAFPFLGVPAGELEGTHAPLDALWGASARALRERLVEAPTSADRFRLLESLLLTSARRPLRHHPAVVEALRAFEDPSLRSVGELNARLGLSPKRLIALFRDEVGLGPKEFWRVRRFQAALRHVDSSRPVRCAELAVELGYCDQAHFNREFRGFVGLSPRAYVAQGVERPNHVPLHE
ncbi:AraC family transcriptional regulator [Archangium violaceum]|uniref:DUF6597 domain-containing transcriptional factor n=1 Tax=Archangium violaceum TaxID=83451 RepID=UPI002B2881AE|nr:AraC family transcriptional regulator [Archangium violaceum]